MLSLEGNPLIMSQNY
jgi:hypothetical protein